ncbi:MAG: ZIP family metal transporter [Gammaproteobacteria bacterium]|nr:ZIP family metal transporter [Gammaproteobacteria bacterium]NNC98042.1 ZIP family metal transporter [Gammaproteobacteria bacterium]NNM14100.1 ZIP family metal transporter [Gammaproteobacteria bacterium]
MSTLNGIIFFTALGGILSILAASMLLLISGKRRDGLVPHLVSFATGALLGAAFLGLLPHALQMAGSENFHNLGLSILIGIVTFFILEKTVLWRHCHNDHCEAHTLTSVQSHHDDHGDYHQHVQTVPSFEPTDAQRQAASGQMILLGDGVHNFLDGILIAAAFLTDFHLGVVTALAVIAHEVPQEVGDVAILLDSGMSKKRAFYTNLAASLTAVFGGILGYYALKDLQEFLPYVLGFAASSFIYIAVADLIPGLHRRVDAGNSIKQILLIGLGILVVYFSHATLH